MKKIVAFAAVIVATLMALVPADAQERSARTDGKLVIGVAMASKEQPRWAFDLKEMQKAAKAAGAELRVRWASERADEQAWQVEALIAQDVDALIVVAADALAAGRLVKSAKDAGIPVIAYDRPIPGADIDYLLTRDNTLVGYLQVSAALEAAPPDASNPPTYVVIKGDQGNVVARDIAAVYDVRLKPLVDAGEIKIVSDRWTPGWSIMEARAAAESALLRGDVDAFVVSNDSMALGVANAVMMMAPDAKPFISGLDADPANDRLIVDGVISMTVWTKIDEMAREAIAAAVAFAKGTTPEGDTTTPDSAGTVPTALIESVPVTAATMCEWITDVAPDGWVTVKAVYGDDTPPAACKDN